MANRDAVVPNRDAVVPNRTLTPARDTGGIGLRPRLARLGLGELRDDLARHEVHADIVGVPAENVLVLRPPAWAPGPGPRR